MDMSQLSFQATQNYDRSMMQSQDIDEFLTTPREYAPVVDTPLFNQVVSPMKKKRGRFYGTNGDNNSSNSNRLGLSQSQNIPGEFRLLLPIDKRDDTNDGPSYLFGLSQDEAQFSQDFTDRFGQQLSVKCNEDSQAGNFNGIGDNSNQNSFIINTNINNHNHHHNNSSSHNNNHHNHHANPNNNPSNSILNNTNNTTITHHKHKGHSNNTESSEAGSDILTSGDGFQIPYMPFSKHLNATTTTSNSTGGSHNNNNLSTIHGNNNNNSNINGNISSTDPRVLNKENAPKNSSHNIHSHTHIHPPTTHLNLGSIHSHNNSNSNGTGNNMNGVMNNTTTTNNNNNNHNNSNSIHMHNAAATANHNASNSVSVTSEKERQITLPPPIINPFLSHSFSQDRRHSSSGTGPGGVVVGSNHIPSKNTHATNIWITAFKERPRYITDFHQEGILGQGTSSNVYSARRRLDGVLYAIKILKTQIYSEGESKIITKEVCAHAALQGCPHVVQYFGCWIDDGYLHIQTELCVLGNLDCLISNIRHSAGHQHAMSSNNNNINNNNNTVVSNTINNSNNSNIIANSNNSNIINSNNSNNLNTKNTNTIPKNILLAATAVTDNHNTSSSSSFSSSSSAFKTLKPSGSLNSLHRSDSFDIIEQHEQQQQQQQLAGYSNSNMNSNISSSNSNSNSKSANNNTKVFNNNGNNKNSSNNSNNNNRNDDNNDNSNNDSEMNISKHNSHKNITTTHSIDTADGFNDDNSSKNTTTDEIDLFRMSTSPIPFNETGADVTSGTGSSSGGSTSAAALANEFGYGYNISGESNKSINIHGANIDVIDHNNSISTNDNIHIINTVLTPNAALVPVAVAPVAPVYDMIELAVWVVLSRIGAAVHYMHERGMAHLDIRPANMFLASNACYSSSSSSTNGRNASTSNKGVNGGGTSMSITTVPSSSSSSSSTAGGHNNNNKTDAKGHSSTHTTHTGGSASGAVNGLLGGSSSGTHKPVAHTPLEVAAMLVNNECLVKLGDFGLVCKLNHQGEIEEGESRYCAREVINGNGPIDLRSADIFSLGASVYELSLGRRLGAGGDDGSAEWHNIRDGILDNSFLRGGRYSAALIDIISRMVHPDPTQRPSASDISFTADRLLAAYHDNKKL